jgi:hypothetical protein
VASGSSEFELDTDCDEMIFDEGETEAAASEMRLVDDDDVESVEVDGIVSVIVNGIVGVGSIAEDVWGLPV